MNLHRRLILLLCSTLTALPTLWAQAPAKGPENEGLVRLERVRRDEKVCVAVDRAGSYQLEKVYPAKSEVYAGTLPATGMTELERALNSDELRQLSQQQISAPPATQSLDQLFIAVRRQDGWQRLSFTTPESRKPFAKIVDPLTKWFDTMAKERPGASSVKSDPTHCESQGERSVATTTRGAANSSSQAQTSSSGVEVPFVMRIAVEHVANGRVARTCATVYPDLHYHLERSEQNPSFQVKPRVYESSVTAEQLGELRGLLDTPEMKALEHTNLPSGQAVREADFTVLSIGRESGYQNLAFSSYFGIQNDRRDPGRNANSSRYSTDEDVKVIKPVRKWLKDAIEGRKVPEIKNAVATDCVP
jgi:hypothetical protein